jgi:hypothetical protein
MFPQMTSFSALTPSLIQHVKDYFCFHPFHTENQGMGQTILLDDSKKPHHYRKTLTLTMNSIMQLYD